MRNHFAHRQKKAFFKKHPLFRTADRLTRNLTSSLIWPHRGCCMIFFSSSKKRLTKAYPTHTANRRWLKSQKNAVISI